jgi:hypothetical protein
MSFKRLLLATFCLSTCVLSASCATKPTATPLLVPVAPSLRERCPRPDLPVLPEQFPTAIDLIVDQVVRPTTQFSVNQEAALNICEARKDAAVAVIDAHNKIVTDLSKKSR